jgi:DNA primase
MAQGRDAVREVRERADLLAIVAEHVVLRRTGRSYVGLCPFHDEHTPSFHVSTDKGLWYCFGCRRGGDVYQFVMQVQGVEFREALELLAERTGVPLAEARLSPAEEERRQRQARVSRALEHAAAYYAQQLLAPAGREARRYLAERAVSAATAEAFGLGYAPAGPDGVVTQLLAKGFAPEDLAFAGIIGSAPGPGTPHDRLAGRLVFPIRNERGVVVGFGGRTLTGGEPKYLNSPDSPQFQKRRLLYGLDRARDAIRKGHEAILVEGYVDVLMMHQHGFTAAVASLGTAVTEDGIRLLRRDGARVLLAYDADRAGRQATLEALRLCDRLDVEARAVRLAGGKDPDEVLRRRGGEAMKKMLEEALPRVEYLLALGEPLLAQPEGKAKVAREVLAAVREHPSAVARDAYLRRVADRLEVSEAALRAEMRRLAGAGRRSGRERAEPSPLASAAHKTEKIWDDTENRDAPVHLRREEALTALVLEHPEVLGDVPEAARLLSDPELGAIVQAAADGAGMEDLAPELRRRAAELLLGAVPKEDPVAVARDLAARLRRDRARLERQSVLRKVRELEAEGQPIPPDLMAAAMAGQGSDAAREGRGET